jgi:hypothetical protein
MKVLVDVRDDGVTLGNVEFRGQWVDFYAILALARTGSRDADKLVSSEAVARVGPWRHKAPKSVGKEVSRHLGRLSHDGLGSLVRFRKRTQAWRLDVPENAIAFVPDRATVQAWVQARSLVARREDDWITDLRTLVDASIALQRGEAETVLSTLQDFSTNRSDIEPGLSAWCALLSGKAADQHDDEEDTQLNELYNQWRHRADSLGRAVSARLRAVLARRYRFEDPVANLASLTKLAAELEGSGDLGGLGAVLNAAGLLTRRAGDPSSGNAHHLRAAALFGITGDYASLQAAVFNLAICRRAAAALRGEPPDEGVLALVDTNKRITARYGVGADSAQAEIAGAAWACEMGDFERAKQYLKEAEALLGTIESTYDHAFFRETRARIEMSKPTGESNPARDLQAAERLYRTVGDEASNKRIRGMLSAMGVEARRAATTRKHSSQLSRPSRRT